MGASGLSTRFVNLKVLNDLCSFGDKFFTGSEDLLDEPFCMFTPVDTSDAQLEPEPEEIEQQWPQLEEEDPDSPCSPHQNTQCDVGSFCDTNVPLVYCTRLIAYKFLLNGKTGGLRRDSEVRISVKALALGCLSAVISLWPEAFVLHLDKQERGNYIYLYKWDITAQNKTINFFFFGNFC
jgi:hypothetical protein